MAICGEWVRESLLTLIFHVTREENAQELKNACINLQIGTA